MVLSRRKNRELPARGGGAWRRGFTLVEILCVVAVMGIASAIILPQMASDDDQQTASAARGLMADLLYAQSRAIERQVPCYVQFNVSTNTYQLMDDSGSGAPGGVLTHPVNGTSYVVALASGTLSRVSIHSCSFDGNTTIAFNSLGVPYSWSTAGGLAAMSSGSIVLQAGTNKLTVSVSPYSGQISVQ